MWGGGGQSGTSSSLKKNTWRLFFSSVKLLQFCFLKSICIYIIIGLSLWEGREGNSCSLFPRGIHLRISYITLVFHSDPGDFCLILVWSGCGCGFGCWTSFASKFLHTFIIFSIYVYMVCTHMKEESLNNKSSMGLKPLEVGTHLVGNQ